jgi:hypothetical protein
MVSRKFVASAALALTCLVASRASAVNQFANPGFEAPITQDGPPFVGSWEGFNAGPGSSAANSTTTPRSGAQDLALNITNTDNSFAGAFQDVAGLTAGSPVTFGGYLMSPSNPLDLGVEMRIEWRNSVSNTEISRTPNLTPVPGSSYTLFEVNSVVPVGADTARAVFAIQTFGPQPTNNGTVFVDDASFEVVPEPATAGVLAFGALALTRLRRRSM